MSPDEALFTFILTFQNESNTAMEMLLLPSVSAKRKASTASDLRQPEQWGPSHGR